MKKKSKKCFKSCDVRPVGHFIFYFVIFLICELQDFKELGNNKRIKLFEENESQH